jgi:arylsulfatase A-like enzyme
VELRDILPTFTEAAGVAPRPYDFDGSSLLRLALGDASARPSAMDLEHSRCYWPQSDWTGLTDERWKYVHWSVTGEEQLFDLIADPNEVHDLAGDRTHADTLRQWRSRMAAHLAERGDGWVKGGRLLTRSKPTLYSPNYPST